MNADLPIHAMPGYLVRRLHQISVSLFSDRVASAGFDITQVQFAALNAAAANPGLDQAGLAGLIAYDRVTIGGVVERLEQKGYLRREISPRDRRARALFVTEAGARVLDALWPIVRELQGEILAGLSEAEQATLVALLKKTTDAGNPLSRAPLTVPA